MTPKMNGAARKNSAETPTSAMGKENNNAKPETNGWSAAVPVKPMKDGDEEHPHAARNRFRTT